MATVLTPLQEASALKLSGNETREQLLQALQEALNSNIPVHIIEYPRIFALEFDHVTKLIILPDEEYDTKSLSKRKKTEKKRSVEKVLTAGVKGQRCMMEDKSAIRYIFVNGAKVCVPRVKSKPIILSEFENRIVQMKKDDGFEFQAEYEELADVGKHQTREAASLEENRMKNRFINILPYDKSRVKLPTQRDSEPGDDYINANYMCGHNGDKEFICCQGPMPSTADDFWCMIWHQNARAIVMLTKCVENGVQKCHHYWPEDETPMRYGDIEVKVMEVDEKRDWTITKLKVTNVKVAQEKQTRYISHFHYTIWPDFGVPGDYNSLICFVREVRSKLVRKGPPVVVHCSAGVGRTGTFIVLDRCLQHILTHDSVDIFGTVWDMRLMRCFMVQKPVQYVFIHEALLSVIKGDEEDATTNGSAAFNKAFEANEK